MRYDRITTGIFLDRPNRFIAYCGIGGSIEEISEGSCRCLMRITDDHRNALGGIMGGAIFTLADFAFAVASNDDYSPTVALDVNIHFLTS